MLDAMFVPIVHIVSTKAEPNNMNWFVFIDSFSFPMSACIVRKKLAHRTSERTTRPIHTYNITIAQGITAVLSLRLG